jgi:hypothetical protein
MIADIHIDVEQHLKAPNNRVRSRRQKVTQTRFLITGATGATGILRSKRFHLEKAPITGTEL